jgi:hypothetical protein
VQNPTNLRRLTIALVLVVCIAAPARDQSPPLPAAELIHEVVANELTDRVLQRKWMYLIDKREGTQTITEEQVETKDGPFYRLLAIDGTPLNPDQRQQDNARMDRLLHDPSQQLKFKRGHDDDEQKLEKPMGLMPEAFLYDYDGVEGNLVRLKFRPNSTYNPPTYEARVAHSLAGTILIDMQQKRLAKLSGQLTSRVEWVWVLRAHRQRRHNRDWAYPGRTFPMEDCPDQYSVIRTPRVLQDNRQTTIRDPVGFSCRFR